MTTNEYTDEINFTVDLSNLYREEAITDLKVASIRRLIPVLADGSDDSSRPAIFIGATQLMTPEGPLPLQARLDAVSMSQACEVFPEAMHQALEEMIQQMETIRAQQDRQEKNTSRIIIPGR